MAAARRGELRPAVAVLVVLGCALSACGSAARPTSVATPAFTPGPAHHVSSPVRIALTSPVSDEVITGSTLHVALTVAGGTITQAYSTDISPTVGHVHLYLDGRLVSMAYSTATDLPVDPGAEYSLYAEWVASDHLSFTPRDVTPKIYVAVSS